MQPSFCYWFNSSALRQKWRGREITWDWFSSAPWRATPRIALTPCIIPNELIVASTLNTSALLSTHNKKPFNPSHVFTLLGKLALDSSHNGQTHAEVRALSLNFPEHLQKKKKSTFYFYKVFMLSEPLPETISSFRGSDGRKRKWLSDTADSRVIWLKPQRVCLSFTNAGAQLELRDQWTGPRRVDLASLHSNQGLLIYAQAGL